MGSMSIPVAITTPGALRASGHSDLE
jgi:hypothetical protein